MSCTIVEIHPEYVIYIAYRHTAPVASAPVSSGIRPSQPHFRASLWESRCAPPRGVSNPGALRLETAAQARVNFREIGGPGVSGPGGIKKPPRRAA